MRFRVAQLAISIGFLGSTITCVSDPPGDGFVSILLTASNAGAEDILGLTVVASRIDVVVSDTADGDERIVEVPGTSGQRVTLTFDAEGFASTTVLLPVPPGFLHQIRIISEGVELHGIACDQRRAACGETFALARIPPGTRTGLKIVPADGNPFAITGQQQTNLLVNFAVADQVRRPPGRGFIFQPTLKAILGAAGTHAPPFVDGQVVVRFRDGISNAEIDAAIEEFDPSASLLAMLIPHWNIAVVSVPSGKSIEDAITFFSAHADVDYTGPRAFVFPVDNPRPPGSPDDPDFADQEDYLETIFAPDAWDRQIGSRTVIVAVFDTGIDADHPDLVNNLFFNRGEIPPGINIVDADGDGEITFVDLNDPQNVDAVADTNGNGFIDGVDVRAALNIDANGVNQGGLADDVDNDEIAGEPTNVVDDLVGARIGTFPAGANTVTLSNAVDDDQAPEPPAFTINGHGTAVAGVIGAEGNNATNTVGVAWNVRILPVKTCAVQPVACDTVTLLSLAMRYARRMGPLCQRT